MRLRSEFLSLTPVSAHFLCQESVPTDYLWQATCGTLGIMINFDAAQHFAAKTQNAMSLPQRYMKPPSECVLRCVSERVSGLGH